MKKIIPLSIVIIIIIFGAIIGTSFIPSENTLVSPTESSEEIRIAFLGDQGGSNFISNDIAVLNLVKDENVDLVLHQGDLGFEHDDPDEWDKRISDILGTDFLYLVSEGHHDQPSWSKYQEKLYDRVEKNSDVNCNGDLGVKSSCSYKDMFFILIAPGKFTVDSDYSLFVETELNNNDSFWRICSMHNELVSMESEAKINETGNESFESCRKGGAIIATGHQHLYSRTGNIIEFSNSEDQKIDPEWNDPNKLQVTTGSTFTFISGTSGSPIIDQVYDKWPVNYSANQNATYGALFCIFNAGGEPNKAYCYFKNIDHQIIDEFTITSYLKDHSLNSNSIDADLSNTDFSGQNLSNKNFMDSKLINSNLSNANLSNSILIGADLTGADLTGADLTNVSLSTVDLTNTKLIGADLSNANLFNVNLSGKDLTGTLLVGADLTNTNLTGKDLTGKDLTGAKLRDMDLSGMDMTNTKLIGSDLTNANIPQTDFTSIDLTNVILDELDLSGKILPNSKFNFVSLKNTDLTGVDLSFSQVREVDFTKTKNNSLANANLFKASLTFSNFQETNMDNTSFYENNFFNSNLSGVDFTKISNKVIERITFQSSNLTNANFENLKFNSRDSNGDITIYLSSGNNYTPLNFIERNGNLFKDYSLTDFRTYLGSNNLYGVYIIDTKFIDGVQKFYYFKYTDFQFSNLTNANFSNSDLGWAVFHNANLTNANFSNSDLGWAVFRNANLTGANLTGADLTNANLIGADLTGADLTGADLTGADLTGADLENTHLNCKNHIVCN